MKTRFGSSRQSSTTELMMTPMIDVVFLLLVFFLATASFEIVEQLLPTGISDDGNSRSSQEALLPPDPQQDVNDCIIRISQVDQASNVYRYQFNDSPPMELDSVVKRISQVIQVKSDIPIIVHPEEKIPIGVAVEIYDQARKSGALRVYFAAR